MPIWNPISESVQAASAKMTGLLVWLSGMLGYLQSDLIQLLDGTIESAHACSDLNGVAIGLVVAAIYGEIVRDPLRRRLAWLALMGMLVTVANAVRIFILTAAAYNTDMRSPLVTRHIWLGWVLIAVAIMVFLVIAGHLASIRDQESPPQAPRSWHGPMPDAESEWSSRFVAPSAESLRRYLFAGSAELTGIQEETFFCLSGSFDLHRVDAGQIFTPTTAVGARENQLGPLSGVRALAARMSTTCPHEISLIHGQDAYLREAAPLRALLARAPGSGS